MLSDAAVGERAAFLHAEQRQSWMKRLCVLIVAAQQRLRMAKGSCFLRTRGADGLLYITVRAGGVGAANGR